MCSGGVSTWSSPSQAALTRRCFSTRRARYVVDSATGLWWRMSITDGAAKRRTKTPTPWPEAVAVLVAHTADDQTETIILSLLRGRSVAGLSGMAHASALPVANAPRALLARPMLAISADVVRDSLRAAGIAWRTDESNDDRSRARNRVRHEVVPALEAISPGFRAALARAARDVRPMAGRQPRLECRAGRLAHRRTAHTPRCPARGPPACWCPGRGDRDGAPPRR